VGIIVKNTLIGRFICHNNATEQKTGFLPFFHPDCLNFQIPNYKISKRKAGSYIK
jgi:hypothetical protein